MAKLTDKDLAALRTLWARTKGEAWEPPDPNYPWLVAMIDEGFIRRVDGRCGFEKFKDSMIAWTEAGRTALASSGDGR